MDMKAEGCARRYLVAVTAVGRRLAFLATRSRKEEREPQLRQSITDVMTMMTIFSSRIVGARTNSSAVQSCRSRDGETDRLEGLL